MTFHLVDDVAEVLALALAASRRRTGGAGASRGW